MIKEYNRKLAVWEMKIIKNIFGQIYNSDLRVYEKIHNEELYCLYGKPNILTYVISK